MNKILSVVNDESGTATTEMQNLDQTEYLKNEMMSDSQVMAGDGGQTNSSAKGHYRSSEKV